MSCMVKDELFLCPKAECDAEKCVWGASLKSLLTYARLPNVQKISKVLTPNACDLEAFTRLAEIGEDIYSRVNPVEDEDYKNLVICSSHCGNGKTAWAIKLLQKYFVQIAGQSYLDAEDKHIFHGCFVPTNQFIFDAKQFNTSFYPRFEETAKVADMSEFTIFDDIGAADYSKYDYTTLYVAIERRIFAHRFCVFTTNFTSEEDLSHAIGERLANRIWRTSEIIEFKGESTRC